MAWDEDRHPMTKFKVEGLFPSEKGLKILFKNEEDARKFYEEGIKMGGRRIVDGRTVIAVSSKMSTEEEFTSPPQ